LQPGQGFCSGFLQSKFTITLYNHQSLLFGTFEKEEFLLAKGSGTGFETFDQTSIESSRIFD
jgi:hypothetical protein